MKIVRVQDIIGTEREVTGPGWTSRRMLLKKDVMGFSFHETIIPAGAVLNLWYKHHLEAVYCVAGNGKILDNGEVRALDVKVGDIVMFGKFSGSEVKVNGDDLLVMREEDIMGVVEG